jgi:hypothetical protein
MSNTGYEGDLHLLFALISAWFASAIALVLKHLIIGSGKSPKK